MYAIVYELHFYTISILKICVCKIGSVIAYKDKTLKGSKNAVSV